MILFSMTILSIGLCYKKGDWKHWKQYYPTILFYIIISINESIITNKIVLWQFYGSSSFDQISDYLLEFVTFPCIIILFLSNYPQNRVRQMIYLASYIFVLSLSEYGFYISNEIKYYNGWNLWWSVLLYMVAFPLLILHYKKPLLAWPVVMTLTYGLMRYFKISLMSL